MVLAVVLEVRPPHAVRRLESARVVLEKNGIVIGDAEMRHFLETQPGILALDLSLPVQPGDRVGAKLLPPEGPDSKRSSVPGCAVAINYVLSGDFPPLPVPEQAKGIA